MCCFSSVLCSAGACHAEWHVSLCFSWLPQRNCSLFSNSSSYVCFVASVWEFPNGLRVKGAKSFCIRRLAFTLNYSWKEMWLNFMDWTLYSSTSVEIKFIVWEHLKSHLALALFFFCVFYLFSNCDKNKSYGPLSVFLDDNGCCSTTTPMLPPSRQEEGLLLKCRKRLQNCAAWEPSHLSVHLCGYSGHNVPSVATIFV